MAPQPYPVHGGNRVSEIDVHRARPEQRRRPTSKYRTLSLRVSEDEYAEVRQRHGYHGETLSKGLRRALGLKSPRKKFKPAFSGDEAFAYARATGMRGSVQIIRNSLSFLAGTMKHGAHDPLRIAPEIQRELGRLDEELVALQRRSGLFEPSTPRAPEEDEE